METNLIKSDSNYSPFQQLLVDLKEKIFLDENLETNSKLFKRVAKFESYFNKLSNKCFNVFQKSIEEFLEEEEKISGEVIDYLGKDEEVNEMIVQSVDEIIENTNQLKKFVNKKKICFGQVSIEKLNHESMSNITQNLNQIKQDIDEVCQKLVNITQNDKFNI